MESCACSYLLTSGALQMYSQTPPAAGYAAAGRAGRLQGDQSHQTSCDTSPLATQLDVSRAALVDSPQCLIGPEPQCRTRVICLNFNVFLAPAHLLIGLLAASSSAMNRDILRSEPSHLDCSDLGSYRPCTALQSYHLWVDKHPHNRIEILGHRFTPAQPH